MPTKPRLVNLLLPEGLAPSRYHALTVGLVAKLAPGSKAGRGYLPTVASTECPDERFFGRLAQLRADVDAR